MSMSPTQPEFLAANLIPGRTYRVKAPFEDYDGDIHPVGETWRFVQKHFLPYEDGLTLDIEQDGQQTSIRLQWLEAAQAQIIEHFSDYVEMLPMSPANLAPPMESKKLPLWGRILIGLAIACAAIVCSLIVLFVVFEIWMAYRPPQAVDNQVPTIGVDLKYPYSVNLDQDFVLEVQIKNSADYAQTLDSIEINTAYLDGVKVNRTDPSYGATRIVKMNEEYLSYNFQHEIPAQSTQSVKFYLTAAKAGTYNGRVAVCINSPKSCPLHFTNVIIKK